MRQDANLVSTFPPEASAVETMTELVRAMSGTAFYPHRPSSVEVKQTHISYVFLAGQYVYKVKKPVSFAFLDYSSLDKRRHCCYEEIRLNRRLAPDVYIGVVPIFAQEKQFILSEQTALAPAAIVEYSVKMRRLPEDRMLDRLLIGGSFDRYHIRGISQKLASFHHAASTIHASHYGTWEAVRKQTSENLQELEPFIDKTVHPKLFDAIKQYSEEFLSDHKGLIEGRLRQHKVRDGHGDLRAEHVCLTDDIDIFDCVEFNEKFRYGDVASEIAFLAMDLDFLRSPDLAEELQRMYADMSNDTDLARLFPFYKCYRACVRGKVESLKSREQEVPEDDRRKAIAHAQRYFRLAYRYTQTRFPPAVLIVCGMAATGKSTLGRILEDFTGFRRKNSDVVRKELAHSSPRRRHRDNYGGGIYDSSFTDRTYATLLEAARKSLREERGIIIDATFKDEKHRRLFLHEAQAAAVPILFIECQAREEEIFRRLAARQKQMEEVSDATREVYLKQRREFAPLSDVPERWHVVFDGTTERPEELLARLEGLLRAGR